MFIAEGVSKYASSVGASCHVSPLTGLRKSLETGDMAINIPSLWDFSNSFFASSVPLCEKIFSRKDAGDAKRKLVVL
jgi:hypothetical protein